MKKILAGSFLLLSLSAQAYAVDLSGAWKGAGRAVDNKGKPINCESVTLTFTHTPASITLNSSFVCEGQPITIPGGAMEIRGTELFDKGVKAGTLTENNLDVVAKSRGYVMQSKAAFTGNEMNLRAVISVGSNPAPVLTFEAALKR